MNDKQAEMVSLLKWVIEDVTNDKIQQSEDISGKWLQKELETLSQQLLKSGSEKINDFSAEVRDGMEELGDWVEKGQNEMDERITALEKWTVKAEGQFCHCVKDKGKKRAIEEVSGNESESFDEEILRPLQTKKAKLTQSESK